MRSYTRRLMKESSETGAPIIRPLFYHFPNDDQSWKINDEYMYGDKVLVAPVTEYLQRKRNVYLPDGAQWLEPETGKRYSGGQTITVDAPLDIIPVFVRED